MAAATECPINHDGLMRRGSHNVTTSSSSDLDPSKLEEIPQPPMKYFGLLGHLPEIDPTFSISSFWRLMDTYGSIYRVNVHGDRIIVGTHALIRELFDEDTWVKVPGRPQQEMRAASGDGLFTAFLEEDNWWKAHRLLQPAFGPLGLQGMFSDMLEISSQLILMWDRYGPEYEIDCNEDLTRLTFDTIGLCAFDYRFNEFYTDEPHPFAKQLHETLIESGKRANRPDFVNKLNYRTEQKRQENITKMWELCDKIVRDREENPKPEATDVLNVLLYGVDRETGEKLPRSNVRFQIGTFLGAGYESTSSSLSFLYYHLCDNPEVLLKAQQEVDEVVGDKVLTVGMLPKLVYINACMKESLRMNPPVNLLNRTALKDTVLVGKYFIKKGQSVSAILRHIHRDPKIWGDDANVFRPERMLNGGFEAIPPGGFKPFGDGLRACIGRGFAEQETLINVAQVLQKFQIRKADPSYKLQMKSNLTTKPANFKMKAQRRPGRGIMAGIPGGATVENGLKASRPQERNTRGVSNHGKVIPVTAFIGGNTGTCEGLAQDLAKKAADFGLSVDIQDLDSAVENLPTDRPCVIITATYEGKPPDNAKKFVAWIEKLSRQSQKLPEGTRYAVFGVGNSDWASTFHRIPDLVNETLASLGADRILKESYSNVKLDIVGPWEEWREQLCQSLSGGKSTNHDSVGVEVSIEDGTISHLSSIEGMGVATVVSSHQLADTSVGAAKRHVGIRLAPGCDYTSGDYLVVQGRNPEETVRRVMTRFGIGRQQIMSVKASRKEFLPTQPVAVEHFLSTRVELAAPVTRRQLATLAQWAEKDKPEYQELQKMQEDANYGELLQRRFSIIDILDDVPGLRLPFGVYLDLLLPLVPRQFSISSSPLAPENLAIESGEHALIASVTFDVFEAPALSGHGTFRGVVSSYLAARKPGDRIHCFVRPNNLGFRLPPDPETPIIMVAAGTGIAPMRAFVEERTAIKDAGVRKLGQSLLFFGCRNPDKDYIYRSELEAAEKKGVVEIIPSFSKPGGVKEGKHVPDALWEHRERVLDMFNNGAKIYLCGSAAKLGSSSAKVFKRIWAEKTGKGEADADEWLDEIKASRYVSDVY